METSHFHSALQTKARLGEHGQGNHFRWRLRFDDPIVVQPPVQDNPGSSGARPARNKQIQPADDCYAARPVLPAGAWHGLPGHPGRRAPTAKEATQQVREMSDLAMILPRIVGA